MEGFPFVTAVKNVAFFPAKKILELPQQAVEATKRLMNLQLEQSVMASLDYANLAEYVSFGTADFNKIVDGLIAKDK